MATEHISAAEYEARRDELANRLHLLAQNSAGSLRMHHRFEAERDRARAELADLVNARAKAIA